MADFLKNRWVLAAVLILFIMLKIPHLLLPYYWDESWPYVPAIMEMHRNGISLLPTAIDPNLSRGHPLFFHALAASWIHISGSSCKSLHAFALTISILFLITIYETGYRFFNKRVAIISLLLVATHVFFYVQSSFVLFEILVAFLSFLGIYLYVREKYILAAICLTALFLTKESGLIAGFIIGIDGLISFFKKGEKWKTRLMRLMPVTVACISIGIFFVLQKHYTGWYFLPLYAETILTHWNDIIYRFRMCSVSITFCQGYEYIIFLALIFYSIIAIIKIRTIKSLSFLCILVPFVLTYLYIDDSRSAICNIGYSVAAFVVFIVFYALTLFSFSRRAYYSSPLQGKFVLLLGFFVLAFVLFSSIAYFSPRYELASIIPTLFILAVFFDMLIRQSYAALYYPLLLTILVAAFFSFRNNKGWGDCDLGFKYGVKTQLAVVEFMERSNFYDKHVACASYLEREHLTDRNTGFLSTDRVFRHVADPIDSATELVIFDNIEPDPRYNNVLKDSAFELIYHINMHDVWADVFRRRPAIGTACAR